MRLPLEVKLAGLCHKALTLLKTCQYFHDRARRLSQGDVAEVCDLVLVEYVNSLQLTALNDRSLRNEQCRPITPRELCSAEQTRSQPRIRR